jgi:hypothetical protein
MKNFIFWDITPCITLKANRSHLQLQQASCYLLHPGFLLSFLFEPDDGGEMFLRNVSCFLTDYMDIYQKIELFKEFIHYLI